MQEGLSDRGRNVFRAHEVSLGTDAARVPVGEVVSRPKPPPRQEEEDAQVELQRADDGTIRAIIVRCPCGRTTTLQCEYFDQGADDETPDP